MRSPRGRFLASGGAATPFGGRQHNPALTTNWLKPVAALVLRPAADRRARTPNRGEIRHERQIIKARSQTISKTKMDDSRVQPVNEYNPRCLILGFRAVSLPPSRRSAMLLGIMDDSPSSPPPRDALKRLLTIMARLRDPNGGCPWDLEQTFQSIAPYTIEEAYEVADAIERGDMADLKEELGDLLLQVVFHARMAEEDGLFDFAAVAGTIADKMVRRHPHVFAGDTVATAAAQTRSWEAHKAAERAAKAPPDGGRPSVLDGVTAAQPALSRAAALQRRAARVGFDWPEIAPVLGKIDEELAELRREIADNGAPDRLEDELGDLLFAATNLARHLDLDAEAALRRANTKFERRFRRVESSLAARGRELHDADLAEMEAAWQAAKAEEK